MRLFKLKTITSDLLSLLVLSITSFVSCFVIADEVPVKNTNSLGVDGGLCLVVGSKDIETNMKLAKNKSLFVQVIQPDNTKAEAWGLVVAKSDSRENMAVRNVVFDSNHYNSNLFNLIVVEDSAALRKTKLADLYRLLTPMGILAMKLGSETLDQEVKSLDLITLSVEGYAKVLQKPIKPVEWKFPFDTKWQAGPQSQISNGYIGISFGAGKLFYLEQMEKNEGDLKNSSAVLVARDAYNGRTLYSQELPGIFHRGLSLVSTSKGRLFVKTSEDKIYCIDGENGKKLFEIVARINGETWMRMLNDDLLCVHGAVYSTETGKHIWTFPNYRYQPLPGTVIGDKVFFCDGKTIMAKKMSTGEELWKVETSNLPKPVHSKSLSSAGNNLLVRMAGDSNLDVIFSLIDVETGAVRWSYSVKVESGKERYFSARDVRTTFVDDKFLIYYRHNKPNSYDDEFVGTQLDMVTGKVLFENKVNPSSGDYHGCFPEIYFENYIVYYDLWVDKKTLETARAGIPHPACFFGMSANNGMVYNFPSRKSSKISAVGPADKMFDYKASSKVIKNYGKQTSKEPTKTTDWSMFRGNSAGGNFIDAKLGKDLVKKWDAKIGLGTNSFGEMSSLRTGLTQAVIAYGLVFVSDIDGQRIVALDEESGKEKWVFAIGSRVDYSPTLYKGLCIFAARNGLVYSLDAFTGKLIYTLQAAPADRFMARQEKLESLWPLVSDVYIVNDIAYVCGTDKFDLAFNPVNGEIVEVENAGEIALGRKMIEGGRDLLISYDMLLKGNSIPRTNEDNSFGFSQNRFKNKLDARVLAFDDKLTVAFQFRPAGEGWANKGKMIVSGFEDDLKKPKWVSEPIELVASDLLLTNEFIYCVGHYQRIKNEPELWVLSRETGELLNTIKLEGFPAFFGLSASGNKLFVATREGNLICYQGK